MNITLPRYRIHSWTSNHVGLRDETVESLNGDDFKPGDQLVEAIQAIPGNVTMINLSNHIFLHIAPREKITQKSVEEITEAFAEVPIGVTGFASINNDLDIFSGRELAQILGAIPSSVTRLHLVDDHLGNLPGSALAEAFAAIQPSVNMLDLSGNNLGKKTSAELAQAFAAIPSTVTTLNLTGNYLGKKTGAELAQAFAAIPSTVTTLNLSKCLDYYVHITSAEIDRSFAAIPAGIIVNYGDDRLQKKYDINRLLDSYLEERRAITDSSNKPKEYFHSSLFAPYQKSFTQKQEAVVALKSSIEGLNLDLSAHLPTLRNGNLGKQLRAFVKIGMANAIVGKPVNTVTDFVRALQERNAQQLQATGPQI